MKLLMAAHNGKSKVIKLHSQEAEDGFLRAACQELGQLPICQELSGILENADILEFSILDAKEEGHYLNMPAYYMHKEIGLVDLIYGPVLLAKKVSRGEQELILGLSDRELKIISRKMRVHPGNLRQRL